MWIALADVAGLALALAVALGWCAVGAAVAAHLPAASLGQRWTLAAVAVAWFATLAFLLLGWLGQLRPTVMLVTALGAGAAALVGTGWGLVTARIQADWQRLRAVLTGSSPLLPVALLATLLAHGTQGLANWASPPLAHDSLHYHLTHIAYWAQSAGFEEHPAIDAWGYYQHMPLGGEMLFGWLMVPARSDAPMAPAGLAIVLVGFLATATGARAVGASAERALLASAAVTASPALVFLGSNAFVDPYVFSMLAAGLALLLGALAPGARAAPEAPEAAPEVSEAAPEVSEAAPEATNATASAAHRELTLVGAMGAMSLAVGAKIPAVIWWGLAALLVVLALRRGPRSPRRRALVLFGVALACLPFVPHVVQMWWRFGSPAYPFPVHVAGLLKLPGHPLLETLLAPGPWASGKRAWHAADTLFRSGPFNFGVGGLFLLAAGGFGLASWLRQRPRDLRWLLLLACVLSVLSYLLTPTYAVARTHWFWFMGRFFVHSLFGLALLASSARSRVVDWLLAATPVLTLPGSFTLGIAGERWAGVVLLLLVLLILGGTLWQLLGRGPGHPGPRKRAPWLRAGLATLALVSALGAVVGVRRGLRLPQFTCAARKRCVDIVPVPVPLAVLKELDAASPRRIALVAGFHGTGHGVLRYHLLGRRWQHELMYVPPTVSGELKDHVELYRDGKLRERGAVSFRRWLARLQQRGVSHLVLWRANVVEASWVRSHPQHFELLVQQPWVSLWRLRQAPARRRGSSSRPQAPASGRARPGPAGGQAP